MDSKQYVPNELDKEFEQFWARVSCYAVKIFPYDQRCNFVQRANSCVYGTNVVPYIQLMACDLKCRNQFEEYVYVSLFLVLCLELLCCMSYVIHNFYGPALKLVARMLHMSEHLAGVTIISIGNELPELVANVWAVHDDDEPNFANALAKGLYLIMFVGGLVCYLSPFKMSGSTTIRDLLFMVCGVLLVDYFLRTDNEMDLRECIVSILLYIIYLIVSVTDLLILRRTTKRYFYSAISPIIYWALNHNTLRQSPCAPIIRLRSMQNFLRSRFRSHTVPAAASSTNEAALGAFNPKLIKLTPKQYRAQASSHYLY
ncbi:putative sodium/calcium exchanger 7 isoform X3 [Drosophila navojoa]|uniref:putative sodium/calcium exchanger 7 isoform X3 n=1 Tax=Drosophila navojoa TaxID=7232 RepID=UPI0011BE8CD0|nr:putative sodium/calcium exchanger 7 isoform X3 [Drosophila navojoa]